MTLSTNSSVFTYIIQVASVCKKFLSKLEFMGSPPYSFAAAVKARLPFRHKSLLEDDDADSPINHRDEGDELTSDVVNARRVDDDDVEPQRVRAADGKFKRVTWNSQPTNDKTEGKKVVSTTPAGSNLMDQNAMRQQTARPEKMEAAGKGRGVEGADLKSGSKVRGKANKASMIKGKGKKIGDADVGGESGTAMLGQEMSKTTNGSMMTAPKKKPLANSEGANAGLVKGSGSGISMPSHVAGRVYCGCSSRSSEKLSCSVDSALPSTPGRSRMAASMTACAAISPPVRT